MNVSEVQKHAIHKKILCWKISAKNFFLISSDIDDCYPSPCKNNGTCIDGVNNYTCSCVPGFEGKNCTISKLLNNFNNLVFFKLSVRDSHNELHDLSNQKNSSVSSWDSWVKVSYLSWIPSSLPHSLFP